MTDESFLICALVSDMPREVATRGSEKMWCSMCAEPVWVSPEGRNTLRKRSEIRIACVACGVPMAQQTQAKIRPADGLEVTPKMLRQTIDLLKERYGHG